MSKKLNPDRERIIQKYVVEEKSLKIAAKELGIGKTTLIRYMNKYGIKKRDRYDTRRKNINFSKEFLESEYKIKNANQIAKEQGCGKATILRYLKKFGIKIRLQPESLKGKFAGKNNPFYGKHHTEETVELIRKCATGDNNGRYIDGRSFLPYPVGFNQHLKDKIRERDNYICQNCAMTEEEHLTVFGTNLHVHHIDYNKFNCLEDNLITLCNNCNNRANFNKTYWQSFFKNKLNIEV